MSAYYALPGPARSVAASLRGAYLNRWRFGAETDRLVESALERDHWTSAQWEKWQGEALRGLLHRAATRVPFYRNHWAQRRAQGDQSTWEDLANWPILTKQTLRDCPEQFVADDCSPRRMFQERTSGTSGTPLKLWWTKNTARAWYALYEARIRQWNGVSRNDQWAMLGGQPVVHSAARRPPFWVRNRPMGQLYMSANHISAPNAAAYREALVRQSPTHLIAYSSSAALLAQTFEGMAARPVLPLVITNAEPLFPWQRDVITRTLGERVRETYGMAEIVSAASECDHGTLHLWPDVGITEVLEDEKDTAVEPGATGRLVGTSLVNKDMPLIRYEVGDRGSVSPDTSCNCGRALPRLASVEGRTNDVLIGTGGRLVYWVNPILYNLPIQEAQIVQESVARITIRYVPAAEFSRRDSRELVSRTRERLGHVDVNLEPVEFIPRAANGKFRAVVSLLSPGERAAALGWSAPT